MRGMLWGMVLFWGVTGAVQSAEPAGQADREQLRAALFDQVRPNKLRREVGESYEFVDIQARRLAITEANANPKTVVLDTLSQLAPFTGASKRLDVVVERTRRLNGTTEIWYRQLIEGIPVGQVNRLRVHEDGTVTRSISKIFDPSAGDLDDVAVERSSADAVARQAIISATQMPNARVDFESATNIELYFKVVDGELVPYWLYEEVQVYGPSDVSFWMDVEVNAITSEAEARDIYDDAMKFVHTICEKETGTRPQCNDYLASPPPTPLDPFPPPVEWTYDRVLTEASNGLVSCTSDVPGRCDPPIASVYTAPSDIIQSFEDWMDSRLPESQCCEAIGDLDVLVNSQMPTPHGPVDSPLYTSGTVVFPDTDVLNSKFNGTDTGQSSEVVSHEVYHHIQANTNVSLSGSSDAFAKALLEGTADVVASLYVKALGESQPWVQGDSVLNQGSPEIRDLTIERTLDDYQESAPVHSNGEVIGNFFYQLSVEGIG